jgi:hypothetical protein
MSDPESQETPAVDEDTRPQRQRDCDALIAALAGFGVLASYEQINTANLEAPMLLAALVQTLVDKGILTDEEVQARKWELMHEMLGRLLVTVENDAMKAKQEAARQEARRFLGRNGSIIH